MLYCLQGPLAAAPPSSPPFDPPAAALPRVHAAVSVAAAGGSSSPSSQMDLHAARLHEIAKTKYHRPHQVTFCMQFVGFLQQSFVLRRGCILHFGVSCC